MKQQPARTEKECKQQRRHDQKMRNAAPLRVTHLPPTDEEVKREIVDPSGQQRSRVREQRRDAGE